MKQIDLPLWCSSALSLALDRAASEKNRDQGIDRALENAELHHPAWSDLALDYLKRYPGKQFMAEEVRVWAHKNGLAEPPHARAWGGVIVKAKKLGLIEHCGYGNVSNPKAHRTPASVWRMTDA